MVICGLLQLVSHLIVQMEPMKEGSQRNGASLHTEEDACLLAKAPSCQNFKHSVVSSSIHGVRM